MNWRTFKYWATVAAVTGFTVGLLAAEVSSAKAEEAKPEAPEQGVLAIDAEDAKTCDESTNCMLVTPAVLKKMLAQMHACDNLKDFKKS